MTFRQLDQTARGRLCDISDGVVEPQEGLALLAATRIMMATAGAAR
ncbi:hypothetical protein I551_0676 [Mycobacterium ulcerans str. Harvey]|uniref:Uncharacterized protein n=1 Tax=Mycobacterium ulcerans str. Harvey TaxID=1299332 RepID=A0ABN0R756_MYCUL|nr:hypothetical protein I551_0676 [Mycobacterium ulcerans str. Harvey]